jgi:hypothetical protein
MDVDVTNVKSVQGAVAQATKFGMQQIAQSQTEGYQGTFKTFGNPYVIHSIKINIEDPDHSERDGHYYIDQVVHEFGSDTGYKMEISIGGKEQ